MDLPPLRFEMIRLDLHARPARALCRPVPGPDATELTFSAVNAPACPQPQGPSILEPPGWPPPTPVPRPSLPPSAS